MDLLCCSISPVVRLLTVLFLRYIRANPMRCCISDSPCLMSYSYLTWFFRILVGLNNISSYVIEFEQG